MQRLHQEVINWEPDRAAPVTVSAEKTAITLPRHVLDRQCLTICPKLIRVVPVVPRQRPQAVVGQELVFVEHVPKYPLEVIKDWDGQKRDILVMSVGRFAVTDVLRQFRLILKIPCQSLSKSGQLVDVHLPKDLDGKQRNHPDDRAGLEGLLSCWPAQLIVVKTVRRAEGD